MQVNSWCRSFVGCPGLGRLPLEGKVDGRPEQHAHDVAHQVAPEEAGTEHEASWQRPAERVEPGCVDQLAELDGNADPEGNQAQMPDRPPGLRQRDQQVDEGRVQGIAAVGRNDVGERKVGAGEQAQGDDRQGRQREASPLTAPHPTSAGHCGRQPSWAGERVARAGSSGHARGFGP